MEIEIPQRLATLGHPQRLAVFRLLMRRYPDRVPATEIAQALDLKPNTLSAYLQALMQAGLVTQQRRGTSRRYAIDMANTRGTFDFLLQDCCRGRPEICAPQRFETAAPDPVLPTRRFTVLFICTGNSARSIFAEALLRAAAGDRMIVHSAGTAPRSDINPVARALLVEKGHDVSTLHPQPLEDFQGAGAPTFDFVFTVCDQAANEDCPAWPGQPITAHWGLPDPVRAEGTDAEKALAFQQIYGALHNRITAFAALPIAALDRLAQQRAVDDIGQRDKGETA